MNRSATLVPTLPATTTAVNSPPALLLGATLLFWGAMTGFLIPALLMALVLEGARYIKVRWDFSDEDCTRIWTFCTLLFLASAVYAFTTNEGPSDFRGLLQNPNFATQRNAGLASARTAASLIRWVPMIFFLFVACQTFSTRQGIPLHTISLILAWRWKKAKQANQPLPRTRVVSIYYPYFALCLIAASIHSDQNTYFFWGLCILAGWALAYQRSRRFGPLTWATTLAVVILAGYAGQNSMTRLQRYFEGFNPRWLSGFGRRGVDVTQSRTALGQIGRLKTSGKIVIRLKPAPGSPPPNLLREASYRNYQRQTWYSGSSKNDFENVPSETNNTTWVLQPEKKNLAAVNLACYLNRGNALLPLPEGCGRLENLAAYILKKNSAGAVLAEGPGLVIFDALYGPGPGIDSSPDPREDRKISEDEQVALDKIVAELALTNESTDQVLRALNGFFQSKFTYSTWQEPPRYRSMQTPLGRFLTTTRSGHCEYFATATVLLLRKLKIPARYAVGFAVHEASGNGYVVRERDAHAWCLVWNESRKAWQDFDTTPASWVESENKRKSPTQWLSDAWSGLMFQFSKVRWGQTHLRQYILWALIPVLALLLYRILFKSNRGRRKLGDSLADRMAHWPGLDSEFYQIERKLSERGHVRSASEPASAWLRRGVEDPLLAHCQGMLRELLKLHYRYRFDPSGLSVGEREALRTTAQACLAEMDNVKTGSIRP
jgi:hypothetical protein